MALIAIGIISKDSDGRGVISVTLQGEMVYSIDRLIGGEREECLYQPSKGGVRLFTIISNTT